MICLRQNILKLFLFQDHLVEKKEKPDNVRQRNFKISLESSWKVQVQGPTGTQNPPIVPGGKAGIACVSMSAGGGRRKFTSLSLF